MSEIDSTKTEVEYRDIPGYPGYRVGNDGTVWSCRMTGKRSDPESPRLYSKWKMMRQSKDREGYRVVGLGTGGNHCRQYRVNRLVLLAFSGDPQPGYVSRHLDGDRTNNTLLNLAWGTNSENAADRIAHGKWHGSKNPRLTKAIADEIRSLYATGEHSYRTLTEKFNTSRATIYLILANKTWVA